MLSLRAYLAGVKHLIPGILYSLPDGLWVYSFTSLMGCIWFQCPAKFCEVFLDTPSCVYGCGRRNRAGFSARSRHV